MAKNTILESALRGKVPGADGEVALDEMRQMLETMLKRVMEAEVSERLSADRYERSDERSGYRNGSRTRRFDTRLGSITLRVPKVRVGGVGAGLRRTQFGRVKMNPPERRIFA